MNFYPYDIGARDSKSWGGRGGGTDLDLQRVCGGGDAHDEETYEREKNRRTCCSKVRRERVGAHASVSPHHIKATSRVDVRGFESRVWLLSTQLLHMAIWLRGARME